MPLHEKQCEQCRAPFRARVKNTLYCYPCRILRDWELPSGVEPVEELAPKTNILRHKLPTYAWTKKARKCSICMAEFWPLKKNAYQCYRCVDRRAGNREEHTCNKCHKHNMPAPGLTDTCWACVTATQERRESYIHVLRYNLRKVKETFS